MSPARVLTAAAPGGVAVLEVRGAAALARLAALAGGRTADPGEVRPVRLAARGGGSPGGGAAGVADLDEAVLVGVPGAERLPGGGAALVELHLHGSPPLVEEVLELLAPDLAADGGAPRDASSARDGAQPRGATLEDRAAAALADVAGELGARVLVDQQHGALRRRLAGLAGEAPGARRAALAALVARSEALRPLLRPLRVVLVGPVNAGKSTLFNLLTGEERAIVSDAPGTTRDALGADVPLGPYAARLVDTAGARAVAGAGDALVERAGQALADALALGADVVLDLARAAGEAAASPGEERSAAGPPRVRLATCADVPYGPDPARWPGADRGRVPVSVRAAPAHARTRVEALVLAAAGLAPDPGWIPGEPVLCCDDLLALGRELARGDVSDGDLARLSAALDGIL